MAYLLVASCRRGSDPIACSKASACVSSTDLSGHLSWVAAWMPTPGTFGGVIGDREATLWAVLGHCDLLDPVSRSRSQLGVGEREISYFRLRMESD